MEAIKTSYGKDEVASSISKSHGYILLKIILIMVSLVVIIVALTQIFGRPVLHHNWTVYVTITFFFWITSYVLISFIYFKSFYLFSNGYILMLCLFHLGIIMLFATEALWSSDVVYGFLKNNIGWTAGPMARWMERSGWYTILALGSFGFGFAVSLKNDKRILNNVNFDPNLRTRVLSKITWDAIGLLMASTIFLILAIKSFGNIFAYSRAEFFHGVGDIRGWGVFLMVFPSAVVLVTLGSKKGIQRIFALSFAATSFAVIMLSGYRSAALFPFLVGIILWVKIGRKIPIGVAISFFTIVVFTIPIIGVLRIEKYEDIGRETISHAIKESYFLYEFTTMGQTAGVLAQVLRIVPDHESYRYGKTYLQALIGAVPNILPQKSESERVTVKRKSFFKPDVISELRPADWITYHIDRDRFLRGEGVGFSAIGEPYINFGTGGVIGFFLLLGWGLGKFDQIDLRLHPNLIIAAGTLYWPFVKTVRNDISNFIKPAIFTIICIIIWRLGTKVITGFKVNT